MIAHVCTGTVSHSTEVYRHSQLGGRLWEEIHEWVEEGSSLVASQKASTMLENAFKAEALLYKQLRLYNHGHTSRSYSRP